MITTLNIERTVELLQTVASSITRLDMRERDDVHTLEGLTLIESPPLQYVVLEVDSDGVPVGGGDPDWKTLQW